MRAHCDGCDEDRETRTYKVTFHSGETALVRYCGDCATLARIDWNGETAAIVASDEQSSA